MRTQFRTLLLTGLLFLGLATGAQAQDKYEFASVTYWNTELQISIEGKPLERQQVEKTQRELFGTAILFGYVSKMQDEGWEVYSVMAPDPGSMRFILRRKKA